MSAKQPDTAFRHSGFFVLRTAFLPFDELAAWGRGLAAPAALGEPGLLEQALTNDRRKLRARLREMVSRPEVRDALFIASPHLDERLDAWLTEPESAAGIKVERTLVRYVSRMAGRATPFGLFAGCSVGLPGERTRLLIEGRDRYQRHTRLDMEYVVALSESLERSPELRGTLTYHPNSSLYHSAGRWRFAEARRNGKGRTLHYVGISDSEYLRATIERAREGASVTALAAAVLQADADASMAEAEEYLSELVQNQVLESDLAPALTGEETTGVLVDRLQRLSAPAAACLGESLKALATIDRAGPGAPPAQYREIAKQLQKLPAPVELSRLFQVDLIKPAAATLGPDVLAEIERGVALLHRLSRPPRPDGIERFRKEFRVRYEGREVPLVEALDEEVGIGFEAERGPPPAESELLEGLTFPQPTPETVDWGRRERLLLGKLTTALTNGADEISLEPGELDELAASDPLPLPDAFAAHGMVTASSEEDLDRGAFRVFLGGASGPSGACLLGRFCYADPTLRRHVEEHLRAEESLDPDAIFAEIVHLSEDGRLGNILCRPVMRQHEIPYLGRSGAPAEKQIPVTDLLVSVTGDQIILRSRRLGRRVLPRLSSAHNFGARTQGIYRFLCGLQAQGRTGRLGWDWGALRDAPFLPRVVSGRLVLARAMWAAAKDELRTLSVASGTERFRAVQAWRTARRLPRWLALVDGDNELPIDLDNVLSVETFVELVHERDQVTLVELFPGFEGLCARGPEGRFVHELLVPFVRKAEPGMAKEAESTKRYRLPFPDPLPAPPRCFAPGSEWLYAKLYTGPHCADEILRAAVQTLVNGALASGAADAWFFIRYADPERHLRVRFHGEPHRLQTEVLTALHAATSPFLRDQRIWRVQLDTYEREVERYGGAAGIVLAEQLFQADSDAVLGLVESYREDARGDVRWRLGLLGMDTLLTDLGFDMEQRREIIRQARAAFAAEFRADAGLKHQLGSRFRQERCSVEKLLNQNDHADEWSAARTILQCRSDFLKPIVAQLHAAEREGRLTLPMSTLAPSFIHMHINRLLLASQREQEFILYDFLDRHYESLAARSRSRRRT